MREGISRLGEQNIWRMLNVGLLSGIGLLGGGSLFGFGALQPVHIVVAVAVFLALAVWDRMAFRGRLIGLAGLAALFAGAVGVAGVRDAVRFVHSYGLWLFGRPSWQPEWTTGYESLQVVWLVLLCYAIQSVAGRLFRLRLLLAAGAVAALLYALFMEKGVSKPCVACMLCYVLLVCMEWNQRRWRKEKRRSMAAYMLWLAPFAAVYFALLLFLSAPADPYDWHVVKDVYRRVSESLTKLTWNMAGRGSEDFDLRLSGFSEGGELGGSLEESDRELMRIYDDTGFVTNLYLSGRVYDTFDGGQWSVRNDAGMSGRYLDTVETAYALRRYAYKDFTDYLRYADYQIDYRYFRSRYLFAPLKLLHLTQDGGGFVYGETGGSLQFDRRRGYGTTYEVSFYQWNGGAEAFDRFLEVGRSLASDEEVLQGLLRDLERRTGAHVTQEDLARYRENVYDYYTEEIVVLEETARYLDVVTADAQTTLEKLRALEAELGSFDYTTTPASLPDSIGDGGDFLDYFLLEGKEGYCSHFATAFTLLARREGLAARYVQGFLVPMEGREETLVYGNMAHAWPEVYLDGIGWIAFEPTPGYASLRYTPWRVQGGEDVSRKEWEAHAIKPDREPPVTEELTQEQLPKEREEASGGITLLLRILAAVLLAVLAAGILMLACSRWLAAYRYARMRMEERFRVEVLDALRVLAYLGIKRKEETLEEFRRRADQSMPREDMLHFLEDYEEVLYGNKEVTPDLPQAAGRQREALVDLLKERKRRAYLRYLFSLTRSR